MSNKRPEFTHHIRRDDNVFIVALRGYLDCVAARGLRQEIEELLNGGAMCVVFDCHELRYTGLSGYGIVLTAAKELQRRKGHFALCNLVPDLKDVFRLAGMMDLNIPIFDSLDAALAVCRETPRRTDTGRAPGGR